MKARVESQFLLWSRSGQTLECSASPQPTAKTTDRSLQPLKSAARREYRLSLKKLGYSVSQQPALSIYTMSRVCQGQWEKS